MLSRIAENVYWVGRYVERADDTVRLVATQYYGNLQVGSSHDRLLPDDLLAILGHPPPGEDLSSLRYAVARCVTAPDNQSSVASCLQAARENARRSREVLPLELWEILSAATRWLEDSGGRRADPDELLREVPQWTRAFYGLVDQAMPRTPAWTMLRLGMLLERADMTLRVLILATDTLAGRPERDPLTVHLWTTALKACAALDASYATTSGFPTRASV
ncbi:MAG: alpha-E domain-containing protein, partial [Actinomycetota bacterium]|nr:alpha-E domain-containing protein [Actinomycetota bacterium]